MLIECWLQKESRWLRKWHWRFVSLSPEGVLRTYASEPRQRDPEGPPVRHSNTSSFAGAGTSFVDALGDESGPGLTRCLLTDELSIAGGRCWPVDVGSSQTFDSFIPFRFAVATLKGRTIRFSAITERSRSEWLDALSLASCGLCRGSPREATRPRSLSLFGAAARRQTDGSRSRYSFSPFSPRHASTRGGIQTRTAVTAQARPPAAIPVGEASRAPNVGGHNSIMVATESSFQPLAFVAADAGAASAERTDHASEKSNTKNHSTESPHSATVAGNERCIPVSQSVSSSCRAPEMAENNPRTRNGLGSESGPPSRANEIETPPEGSLTARSRCLPPPMPPRKGKGKGTSPPPPPPPRSKGKGKGKGTASLTFRRRDGTSSDGTTQGRPHSLPIGRRLSLKMQQINAEAFRGILSQGRHDGHSGDRCGDSSAMDVASLEARADGSHCSIDLSAVDLAELREAFAPVPKATPRRRPTQILRVELMPRDVAQNVAIVLMKLSVGTAKLAEALTRLEPSVCMISADEAERLLDVWPSLEVLRALLDYEARGGDVAQLRDVERQMLPMALLPRMGPRLRLMVLVGTLAERTGETLRQLALLQAACNELRSSAVLRELLAIVLVLFNYVNFGTEAAQDGGRERLQGVDVQSLLRLRETKAYNGDFQGFNMLHFVLKQLLRQRPQLTPADLSAELAGLPAAASVSLERMRQELAELRADYVFVRGELYDHRSSYEEPVEEPAHEDENEVEKLREKDACSVAEDLGAAGVVGAIEEEEKSSTESPAGSASVSFQIDSMNTEDATRRGPSTPRPPVSKRRSLMKVLLGKGVELASVARGWMRGDELIGLPDLKGAEEIGGFGLVRMPDGEAPPPGWLWLLRPSKRWQLCWVEIRGPFLVVYRINGNGYCGATFAVLARADVAAFASLNASSEARELAESAPYGFEVCTRTGQQTLKLCASRHEEAERWTALLDEQSRLPGTGFLAVYDAGNLVVNDRRQHFCYCRRGWLLCFARPRDGLEGRPPDLAWQLSQVIVRSFSASAASSVACRLAENSTYGFEVEEVQTRRSWQFTCEGYAVERAWLEALTREMPHLPGVASSYVSSATIFDSLGDSSLNQAELFEVFAPASARCPALAANEGIVSSKDGPSCGGGDGDACDDNDATTTPPRSWASEDADQRERALCDLRHQLVLQLRPPKSSLSSSSPSRRQPQHFAPPEQSVRGDAVAAMPEDASPSIAAQVLPPSTPPPSHNPSFHYSSSSERLAAGLSRVPSAAAALYQSPSDHVTEPVPASPTDAFLFEIGTLSGPSPRAAETTAKTAPVPSAVADATSEGVAQTEKEVLVASSPSSTCSRRPLWKPPFRKAGQQVPGTASTSRASPTPNSSAGSGSTSEEESDEESDCDAGGCAFDGDCAGSRKKVSPAFIGCVKRLELLERDLAENIALLSRALSAAEADCRDILVFFGLEAPAGSGPRLGTLSAQLLESLANFVRQVHCAWEELVKHRRNPELTEQQPRTSRSAPSDAGHVALGTSGGNPSAFKTTFPARRLSKQGV